MVLNPFGTFLIRKEKSGVWEIEEVELARNTGL